MPYTHLWNTICGTLDAGLPKWRQRILDAGQVSAVQNRQDGHQFTDTEIFEGVVKAVLSNSIDWSRIEAVLPELRFLFHEFEPAFYADIDEQTVDTVFVPWFRERRAGSLTMKQNLQRLRLTARTLCQYSEEFGSLNQFLTHLGRQLNNDTITLAQQFGSPKSRYKLPAIGLPVSAEAMKNIGFDVAKPDRHINRALGSFGLVVFANWKVRTNYKAPLCSESEMINVMRLMKVFADAVGVTVTYLDNAIWLLCCRSGLYLKNQQLSRLIEAL